MATKRTTNSNRAKVLEEYNHRCAICGGDKPHVHHIDENPSNHHILNLLPLCPNFHLTVLHSPYTEIDSKKLELFRIYKNKKILTQQFHPIFVRLKFLDSINDASDANELGNNANELIRLLNTMQNGQFFSEEISKLIKRPSVGVWLSGLDEDGAKRKSKYLQQLIDARDKVYSKIDELLHFQNWNDDIKCLCGK